MPAKAKVSKFSDEGDGTWVWYLMRRLAELLVGVVVRQGENDSKTGCKEPGGAPHREDRVVNWGSSDSKCAMKRGKTLSGSEKVA